MNRLQAVVVLSVHLVATTIAGRCWGHGTPIVLHAVDGRLTVSGGIVDDRGYASWFFADDDESAVFGPAGPFLLTTLPGLSIFDLAAGEQLSLEIVPRPDFTQAAAPLRWLWYWDNSAEQVADVPQNATLEIGTNDADFEGESIVISQSTGPAGPLLFADLDGDELGVHSHLLSYLLDNSPAVDLGGYGLFVRLASPTRQSSAPFLITLNHALDAESFQRGARLINAAARLPGDYDGDDDSDGADFLVWQRALSSTAALAADGTRNDVVDAADLAVWRDNFGESYPAVAATTPTPEPASAAVAIIGTMLAALRHALAQGRGRHRRSRAGGQCSR